MKKLNKEDIIEKIIELEEMLDDEEEDNEALEEFRKQCRKVAKFNKIMEEELGMKFSTEDIIRMYIERSDI